ncbi:hypothetical protein JF714_15540 [Mycobacterium avium]|uniref:hypothetical protein n=1 Tax=Mycobacterium avium TaxID=1764 RepID=UPI001CDAB9EF|nr:hypothetical protein [Mycobacterium avium]MCA2331855.1 hypothetical protein [Mycobacterium avium]
MVEREDSMRDYKPRRCSKRWLDGDCPAEVLAIIDHGEAETDRYDVIYSDVQRVKYDDSRRAELWLGGLSSTERGAVYHFELQAHEVSAYRYRFKHRYARWSDLPEAVKAAVRRDLAEA